MMSEQKENIYIEETSEEEKAEIAGIVRERSASGESFPLFELAEKLELDTSEYK